MTVDKVIEMMVTGTVETPSLHFSDITIKTSVVQEPIDIVNITEELVSLCLNKSCQDKSSEI